MSQETVQSFVVVLTPGKEMDTATVAVKGKTYDVEVPKGVYRTGSEVVVTLPDENGNVSLPD